MNIPLEIILFCAGSIIAAIAWQFKKHDSRIESVENNVDSVKLVIANEYSKKTEVERLEHAMLAKLDRIENKQDNLLVEVSKKQDRP